MTAAALERMTAARFTLCVDGPDLVVSPADRLTEEQRAYIRAHKAALIDLLTGPVPPALPTSTYVTCSTCRHGQLATPNDPQSWHLCLAGADRLTGWGLAARQCEGWEVIT